MKLQLRNNLSKKWSVKTFDFIPYLRILTDKEVTEIELGWLCFGLTLIYSKIPSASL